MNSNVLDILSYVGIRWLIRCGMSGPFIVHKGTTLLFGSLYIIKSCVVGYKYKQGMCCCLRKNCQVSLLP